MTATPAFTPDQRRAHPLARLFFKAAAAIALGNAAVYGFVPLPMGPGWRLALVLACVAMAGGFLWAVVLLRNRPIGPVIRKAAWAASAVTVLSAVATGQGAHAVSLGYLGLFICLVTVLSDVRAAVRLAIAGELAIVALAAAQFQGWLPVPVNPLHVFSYGLLLAASVVSGTMMARMVNHALHRADEREQRFRGLLALAADLYWEVDRSLRFVQVDDEISPGFLTPSEQHAGRFPWDLDFGLSEADRLATRAAMEAHQPFSELRLQRVGPDGRARQFVISGRPRFDSDGQFLGYWGVGKEITGEVLAQQAVRASERRYQELFTRSPTPLLVHRDGVVIDANEAAARMFGHQTADSLLGTGLLERYAAGPSRTLQTERLADLQRQPVGSALEMADFQLNSVDGRRLTTQATDVRVNQADGPATLSIYHDITARVAAENALRRSEVMLTHMFATSPDFITLSELDSGRYLMVNDSFTRIFGYAAEAVVGKSALDLGFWYRPEERRLLLERVNTQGEVHELPATFVNQQGEPVSLLLSAARFELDGRAYMVVNGRDVTETQRVQHEHEAMLQNALIGIALTRRGRFVQVNDRFECMFGWEPGTLAGQPEQVVWLRAEDAADPAPEGPLERERVMRRRDGSTFIGRVRAQALHSPHPGLDGTIWIAEDVTERRQMDQALADARDRAEAANRAKSAFLANTSHEIRTPLNGLLGMARLAMQPGIDERRRQQYLAQIHDSAQSLAGIISDILDLSKIEAGKFSVESVPFDLRNLLGAVHHAYQSLAHAHSLALQLEVDARLPDTVRGDPLRLRQILSNYITNGLKFTARGHVRIEATASAPGWVRFSVADTGPGIDAATRERLFEPFTQADESTTRRFGGTGLGLSICKELAALMGGRVGVDSTPGQGSRFWAELPLPEADPLDLEEDDEAQDIVRLTGVHVLLVEDNPVNMLIGVSTLEQWGVDVVQATDGHEAIEAVERAVAARRPFDVVLMDVQMPRLSGHEAARRLRQQHTAEALPIIALTAAALVSEREEAMAAGMNDFLTKPLDAATLRKALVRVVEQHSQFGALLPEDDAFGPSIH
jgi:PAS domain S-box-containing protein